MDRPTTRTEADARAPRPGSGEDLVLPSRRPALDLCRMAQSPGGGDGNSTGPVLVTGDAGVGKTWLWRRAEAEAPTGRRRISVDVTPSDGPVDFYRLIAHELGLVDPSDRAPATSRVGLADFLAARQADGDRVGLVVEEAHNLSAELWEEVRVLANRLDRPGGFSSMILVGQTSLALRFLTRPFAAIEARLASKIHLGPIGVDEAKELLGEVRPGREWSNDEVEILHRDASGNPRRLLRMVGPRALAIEAHPAERPRSTLGRPSSDLIPVAEPAPVASPAPLTGPAKPPISVEDNMIEVGWAAEDALSPEGPDEGSAQTAHPSAGIEAGEEAVRDHYAALQAWREWSENQARRSPRPIEADPDDSEEVEDIEDEVEDRGPARSPLPLPLPLPLPDRPTVRTEGEQKFAPFGQLFTRMAQAREPG